MILQIKWWQINKFMNTVVRDMYALQQRKELNFQVDLLRDGAQVPVGTV